MGHPKGYSQSELSHLLGYKNGQFISNVERGLCNIPLKMLKRVSEVLLIPREELKQAILDDHENTLDNYLSSGNGPVEEVEASAKHSRPNEREEVIPSTNSFLKLIGSYLIEYQEEWHTANAFIDPERLISFWSNFKEVSMVA